MSKLHVIVDEKFIRKAVSDAIKGKMPDDAKWRGIYKNWLRYKPTQTVLEFDTPSWPGDSSTTYFVNLPKISGKVDHLPSDEAIQKYADKQNPKPVEPAVVEDPVTPDAEVVTETASSTPVESTKPKRRGRPKGSPNKS